MKKLLVINGTMGVGKTDLARELFHKLEKCAWLDGDWCWMTRPFQLKEEEKAPLLKMMSTLLRHYLDSSHIEIVIFSWVIPRNEILQEILNQVGSDYELLRVTLIANEQTLRDRIAKRRNYEARDEFESDRSLQYAATQFQNMQPYSVETSGRTTVELSLSIIEKFSLL